MTGGWNDLRVWCVSRRPSAEALDGRLSGQCLVPEPAHKAGFLHYSATRLSLVAAPQPALQGSMGHGKGSPRAIKVNSLLICSSRFNDERREYRRVRPRWRRDM